MAKERADVRNLLANRRKSQHLQVVDLSDIDAEISRRQAQKEKRRRGYDSAEDDEEPPSQRLRGSSPIPMSSPIPPTPSSPPAVINSSSVVVLRGSSPIVQMSPPIVQMSPPIPSTPSSLPAVINASSVVVLSPVSQLHTSGTPYVPASCVHWPDNMYTVDMKQGFALVDSPVMRKHHARITDRVAAVFRRSIPETTYYDQRRHWKRATEQQRQAFSDAGHTPNGLWSNFPK